MAKTPSKGKKPAAPPKDGAGRAKAAGRPPKVAKPASADPDVDPADLDDDEDDEEEGAKPAKAAAPAAKKPAARSGRPNDGPEPPPVIPARRLTPEAKAKVNEMVAKGMPLGDALKIAASWETFVAPVKDEPAKLVQGKSFDGTPRPRPAPKDDDESDGPEPADEEEPVVEAEE